MVTFQQFQCDVLHNVLPPFALEVRGSALPVLDLKLGESTRQVDECHCDDLGLPLQTQCGTEAGTEERMERCVSQ